MNLSNYSCQWLCGFVFQLQPDKVKREMTLSGISKWLHYCAKAKGLKSSDLWIQALCSSRARFLRASFSSHRICWSHGTCDEACRRIWCGQGRAFLKNSFMHGSTALSESVLVHMVGQSVSVEMILVCQANVSVYLVLCSTLLEQWFCLHIHVNSTFPQH